MRYAKKNNKDIKNEIIWTFVSSNDEITDAELAILP